MTTLEVARLVYFGVQHRPKWLIEDCTALPEVAEGEMLLQVRLATLSASDVRAFNDLCYANVPSVLGCEAVCEVIEDRRVRRPNHNYLQVDGPNEGSDEGESSVESRLPRGSRITFGIKVSCNKCNQCRNGFPQNCDNVFHYGRSFISAGAGFTGTYATHILLKEGTHVVEIPPELPDRIASTANRTLASVINAVEQARNMVSNEMAVVQGAGLHGLFACALLRRAGYKRVLCCDVDQSRLTVAEQFGGEPVLCVTTKEDYVIEALHEVNGMVDCVFKACEGISALEPGICALRPGGTYVWSKMWEKSDKKCSILGVAEEVVRKNITIKGVHGYKQQHLQQAVQFLKETWKQYPFEEVLSLRPYRLRDFEEATNVAASKTFHRVCIKP